MNNYVLIKPDADLETYQWGGKETNIIAPSYTYDKGKVISTKEKNQSVKGTVYGVPMTSNYFGKELDKLNNTYSKYPVGYPISGFIDKSVQKQADEYRKKSLAYDSPIEIQKGDRVFFTYLAHNKAKDDGRIVSTEHGDMLLIPYDMLYMTIKDNKPERMLNGWVIIEPETVKTETINGVHDAFKTKSGIILQVKDKRVKTRKAGRAKVLYCGTPNKGYFDYPKDTDQYTYIESGDTIIYDPRGTKVVEVSYHRSLSEQELLFIQRRDIRVTEKEFPDIHKIDIKKAKI